jgi:MFS family permease
VNNAVDLASKVLAVLAALLGLAGYVLVLGATILWFRLDEVGLPHDIPISLAGRQELIAIGAQAVAVWLLLAVALGVLATWIVGGDPERRRFGHREAALAIAVTVSTVLALGSTAPGVAAVPIFAALLVALGACVIWPSAEAVIAAVLPVAIGLGLAFALSSLHGNGVAEAVGATFIFGALFLLAPSLQRWRARQEANRAAIARIEAQEGRAGNPADAGTAAEERPLVKALRAHGREDGPNAVLWIRRVAVGAVALLILGAIAVASQVERHKNFHRALVSLTNGDCVTGTYIVRGSEQIVLAQASREDEEDERDEGKKTPRITTIPTKEVLEVQVFGKPEEGADLKLDAGCGENHPLVSPAKSPGSEASAVAPTHEG